MAGCFIMEEDALIVRTNHTKKPSFPDANEPFLLNGGKQRSTTHCRKPVRHNWTASCFHTKYIAMNTPKIRTPEREAKIRRVLGFRQKDLTLVLSNIHDPHNVSAIYRSCDAFGVPEVHLHYTDTPFPVLGAKSSASARKWVRSVRHKDMKSMMDGLHARGIAVYATMCTPEANPIDAYDYTRPTAFILGNEHGGVEESLAEMADGQVYIPMYGMIQSFNVSVAAAVLLAEASRQRKEAGMYARPSYEEAEMEAMYNEWMGK